MFRHSCGNKPAAIFYLLVRFIVLFHLIWSFSAQVDWFESQYHISIYNAPGTYIKFTLLQGLLVDWDTYCKTLIFGVTLILWFFQQCLNFAVWPNYYNLWHFHFMVALFFLYEFPTSQELREKHGKMQA